ncbi:Acetyltransferase (GNAT) domain-containing protein [Noviherbaspirillum humi]|uniref:Acetyltransferase (GNAT) domain-containing protein n=1 Tax=Noviherbaspirillum humi TaxID=1688639 RepID=A0A239KLG8_9BURK|nr:GNAT family N-acetyltransferase [Noviherbaspirillum humi]SNT19237.1 Acetyltransferase (GNAT) domain-containing protein [Noviherbaspirillum humi]
MSDEYVVSHYEGDLPDFIGPELDRLYGSRFCSLHHLRIHRRLAEANAYVLKRNGIPVAIFLFEARQQRIRILNEGMRVETRYIDRFADWAFERYPEAISLTFNAVEPDGGKKPARPVLRAHCAQDMVLPLPESVERYVASLGKSTRHNIKRRISKLKRTFPDFDYRFLGGSQVREEDIRSLIRISEARLSRLGKAPNIDARETRRIGEMVKACGFVCIATIRGELCGGQIAYHLGETFCFRSIAHEAAYDEFSLGSVVFFLTICECIRQGAKRVHLGWGSQEYKFQFGAVNRDIYRLVLYRSWPAFMLDGLVVGRTAFQGALSSTYHRLATLLKSGERNGSHWAKLLMSAARRTRRALA